MPAKDIIKTPYSRVFTIDGGASPLNTPEYQGLAKAMSASQSFGDLTPIRSPDPSRYNGFITDDVIEGDIGLPTLGIQSRYRYALDEFLRIAKTGCEVDVQVHFGKCQDPRDFNGGWDKILVLEKGKITNWSTGDMGALESSERAVVNVDVPFTGRNLYEIKRMVLSEIASAEIVQEVIDVAICDSVICAICGLSSNGCKKAFALTLSAGGSPGLPAEIIYTDDGFLTVNDSNIESSSKILISFIVDNFESGISGCVFISNLPTSIQAGVVDDNALPVFFSLI